MQYSIVKLKSQFAQYGKVELITIRPQRRATPEVHYEVDALADVGLAGDHYASKGGKRQVTFIMMEHLKVVESILNLHEIDPLLTRRNIVTSGINLIALKDQKFKIGEAVFEGTGECHPCSRMEENFGKGGYNAMRSHGGLTAKVLETGRIKEGDEIIPLFDQE